MQADHLLRRICGLLDLGWLRAELAPLLQPIRPALGVSEAEIVDPPIRSLGFDPIWFGVVMVIVLEMGLISPPDSVNVFVVKRIAPDAPLTQIFRGILLFCLAMVVCLALLVLLPDIAMPLPGSVAGQ